MFRKTLLFAAFCAAGAHAQDAVLRRLIDEASAASPELAQARATADAEHARVSQAGAWPDPSVQLGVQNDTFTEWNVGKMETSFFLIGVTQPLPWPGKRALREEVASAGQKQAQARLARVQLDVEASVRRAYLGLLLARGELELLEEQERLWMQAGDTARSRYEAGQAPQSDLLRAQLERARLQQRRWALDAELQTRTAELNRLRAHPLDEPIETQARLADAPEPSLPSDAQADAEERSPELKLAELTASQAQSRVELARKEEKPDFAVSAAVMPRGSLDPMWSLNLSVGLPIFSGKSRAVDEGVQRQGAEAHGVESLRRTVRLRARERQSVLDALVRTNRHSLKELLVLSQAAARSTLSQYEVGRLPFAAVLEALSGYVADRNSWLASLAAAQAVLIAQDAVSLEAPAIGEGSAGGAMPGTSQAAPVASAAAPSAAAAQESAPARPMGGM